MGFDYQMQYLKKLIWRSKERINKAKCPEAEVTNFLYDHILHFIRNIIDVKKYAKGGKIVILGGIQINATPDDYFEPKCFY